MKEKAESLVREYHSTRNPELREPILIAYKSLLHYICRKLAFNSSDYDDLYQIASVSMIKALDRFDPSYNTDFSAFVTPNIIGEIKHYFRDKSQVLKIPRKLQETYGRVKAALRSFNQEGINPTISDLAKRLEMSEEAILEALEAGQNSLTLSLDAPPSNSFFSDSGSEPKLIDQLKTDDPGEASLTQEMLRESILKLDPRERRIIYLRFYGGFSQAEIGERMDLSQMHISRLLTKAVKNLRKHLPSI